MRQTLSAITYPVAAAIKPSVGAWLDSAKNYADYSNEGGEYDELAAYLRRRRRR